MKNYTMIASVLFSILIMLSLSVQAEDIVDNYPTPDTMILLNDANSTVDGDGVTIDGTTIRIDSAGTYSLSGTLADGQIVVDSDDDELVTLILNDVNLSSSTSAPIYIKNADSAAILLADGTENYVTDGTNYVYENVEDDEPSGAVFSDDDLTIYGEGSLVVTANFNDGIVSKDGLIILNSTISITSVDDGIRGKDYLLIDGAQITLNVQGDGLKSDLDEDTTLGYISIASGVFHINAGGDAIQAETRLNIINGDFTIVTAGGSSAILDEDVSAKGLKAGVGIVTMVVYLT